MPDTKPSISVVVSAINNAAPNIKVFTLSSENGSVLPAYAAGAHIKVSIGGNDTRCYSLTTILEDDGLADKYRLGVLLDDNSTGGSRFMHGLELGDTLIITPPKNDFSLLGTPEPSLLFAGGIGITPIYAMAEKLMGEDVDFTLHYAGRAEGKLAFVNELTDLIGERLHIHYDDQDNALELSSVLNKAPKDTNIYVCGPKGMIEAVKKFAAQASFPKEQIHFELFNTPLPLDGNKAFEIEIASSGKIYTIPADKSIIEVLKAEGEEPLYDCAHGNCGICRTQVISGDIDHRDVVLSDSEKAGGNVMQICVSRAKSGRLVLDLHPKKSPKTKNKLGKTVPPMTNETNDRKGTNGVNLDALVRPGASEIHRDVFTSQTVFEQEMKTVFRRTWVYVGHDSQVQNKGDFTTTTIGNQPVIMVRHTDGDIQVLYNRCPHKGTQIVNEPSGNTGKFFRCPYHAWSFKTDGSPLGIPFKQGYENTGFDKSCAKKGMCVVSYVKNYRGFVFACLSYEGESFEEFFGGSLSSIDNMIDRSPEGRLEVVGAPLRYLHHCNWKMLVDNQTDACHPMIAHESSAGTVKQLWEATAGKNTEKPMVVELVLPFMSSYETFENMGIRTWDHGHGHTGVSWSIHSDYSDVEGYLGSMIKSYGEKRAQEILAETRHNTCYFPNIMVKGAIQTLRLFKPIAADKTIVESWIFKLVGAPDTFLKRTAMYNRIINAPTSVVGHDDLEMYERAQEGLKVDANPWMNLQRHYQEDELGGEQVHPGTSEVQMRNTYTAWAKYMRMGDNS
ncbi:MAG: Rieske 2Fe-2S domain-containing protein [Robiginitomaculum sp.]